METARALATAFHQQGVQLVYGGGTSGLMGELARTLVSLSGPQAVHGIIPRALIKVEDGYKESEELTRDGSEGDDGQTNQVAGKSYERTMPMHVDKQTLLRESAYGLTTIVPDMHTRKRLMATKVLEGGPGSGFVALAGGFGTLEELMEMTTWNQLGIHKVGVVVLNTAGYWNGLLEWIRNSVKQGFVSPANAKILVEVNDVNDILPKLKEYKLSLGRFQLNWG
jgi:uncharacterized protein (TIGR00730 family)